MILKRLREAASRFNLPPEGYREQAVKWVLVLDREGKLLGVVSTTGSDTGGKNRGKRMLAPTVLRTSGVQPQLLADKADYALGIAPPHASLAERRKVASRHEAFTKLVEECAAQTNSDLVRAVAVFLRSPVRPSLPDIVSSDVVTFEVEGRLVVDLPEVREYWASHQRKTEQSSAQAVCLVCGQEGPVASPHPVQIKRVPGGQTSGCALVSVNSAAFDSYGHGQELTQSPVCFDCARAYAHALNSFLESSRHSYFLGDRAAWVFWTREPTDFDFRTLLFAPGPEDIRALFESVVRGKQPGNAEENAFYALFISGSGGRVVIRDWLETTVPRVQDNLARYFQALSIVELETLEVVTPGLGTLLASILPHRNKDPWQELPPQAATALIRCALLGRSLPPWILERALSRCRAERGLTHSRAALIKLCLAYSFPEEEVLELSSTLDHESQHPGYLCGRLLAILENIQRAAVPGINATVVERYFGSAASSPASVLGPLLRQAQFHLGKLRRTNEGAYVRLQSALEEVMRQLREFPAVLNLKEQGLFALGYYHQRAQDKAERLAAVDAKRKRSTIEEIA
ncbi:MAG: type I-C CRISPR-associated protein Cas8c/Csd1 [Thermoleophilia bacterium]|nr:type I-C CRISPR-associated protein Cas8c/Csd1 [Thermoleophilia bacterium]